jgi:hypothetical protein
VAQKSSVQPAQLGVVREKTREFGRARQIFTE